MDVVLIPAYEPDQMLIELTQRLKAEGFSVLVVDDGSGERYTHIFDAVKSNATVIALSKNRGKGAALKHGMKYIKQNLPECEHFITCDADGQHKVEDVVRVSKALHKGERFVLTVRNRKKDAPLRSRFGNDLSRFVYTLLANRYLSDNQSGLRGFSIQHIDWLMQVERDNYDYEMNVLYYAAKQGVKITTLPIEAIYIGNNESSHFKPIADTVKIYKSLFTRAFASIISFMLCEVLVIALSCTLGYNWLFLTLPGVGAVGCATTIILNRFIFFRHANYFDYLNTVIYTIIYYFLYTLGCLLFYYAAPSVPIAVAFNLVYIVFIPLKYLFHKFISIAARTKE